MIFRFIIAVVLALAAIGLFWMNRSAVIKSTEPPKKDFSELLARVDRDVDTVLARFNIEKEWMKKREIPGSFVGRIERRVLIPPDVQSVQINLALNTMVRRYGGRAIASENLKENTIAIHIEFEGYILESLILKPSKELKRVRKDLETTT